MGNHINHNNKPKSVIYLLNGNKNKLILQVSK